MLTPTVDEALGLVSGARGPWSNQTRDVAHEEPEDRRGIGYPSPSLSPSVSPRDKKNFGRSRSSARSPPQLPMEARTGLMRAWIAILRTRHPDVTWIPVGRD